MTLTPTHSEVSTPKNFIAVSQSDSVNEVEAGGLYVGTAGDVKFTTVGGQDITLTIANDETWIPVMVKRVWSTGTTASNIYIYF